MLTVVINFTAVSRLGTPTPTNISCQIPLHSTQGTVKIHFFLSQVFIFAHNIFINLIFPLYILIIFSRTYNIGSNNLNRSEVNHPVHGFQTSTQTSCMIMRHFLSMTFKINYNSVFLLYCISEYFIVNFDFRFQYYTWYLVSNH